MNILLQFKFIECIVQRVLGVLLPLVIFSLEALCPFFCKLTRNLFVARMRIGRAEQIYRSAVRLKETTFLTTMMHNLI